MQQGLSLEASASEIGKKFLLILRNLKFLYRVRKSPTLVTVLREVNPVYSLHPVSFEYILILSSYLRLGFPCYFIPLVFPTTTLYALLFSPTRATCPLHFIHFDSKIRIIFSKKYKLWRSLLCSFFNHLLLPPSKAKLSCWAHYS